ncbi:MAG: DAK2 domain-containing protein [Spirochaetales bacterium]|nr:DAK2 domain-containing protein [Spirochaetales bacterium]
MPNQILECGDFTRALFTSAEHLNINLEVLDNLNVFPVPDGDTGANMGATFIPAVKILQDTTISSCREIGQILVPRMDNHSRGNSGFIISRFFKGFFSSLEEAPALTVDRIRDGFSKGYFEAHTALFNPVEGTMISIISSMTEAITGWDGSSVRDCLENAVFEARKTLFETPAMLPVLARAGVVDSGALGFICIIEGLLLGLNSKTPFQEVESEYRFIPDPEAGSDEENQKPGQFCTELTMQLAHSFPEKEMREYLIEMGNSIALVKEDNFVKLHIHTDFPDQVMNKFEQFGAIVNSKVDDIYAQIKGGTGSGAAFKGCEVLPCVPGEGFRTIFNELGVENVLVYGTALPSALEILEAINRAGVEDLIILPNDNNILPACMTAKDKSDKHISILPTRDIVQGLTAYYGFSENEELEINTTAMQECLELADSFFLYQSTADRSFGGVDIKKDHYFLLKGKEILSVELDYCQAVMAGLLKVETGERGNITLFYKDEPGHSGTGQDVSGPDKLSELQKLIEEKYPHLEVELLYGGQARGDLIISLE